MRDPSSCKRRNMLSASFGIVFPTDNFVLRLPCRESGEASVIIIFSVYKTVRRVIAAQGEIIMSKRMHKLGFSQQIGKTDFRDLSRLGDMLPGKLNSVRISEVHVSRKL